MLMNNLDPEVAERPEDLVVYGGIGESGSQLGSVPPKIIGALQRLEDDQTLLIQSGKPVGIFFRTHPDAPRVLLANSNLVPHWATWEHFHELDRAGLMMYGQMNRPGLGSTLEAKGLCKGPTKHLSPWPKRILWKLVRAMDPDCRPSASMGGAQPLAATMDV